ncbi:MAG: hypothetical protein UV70_C0002G0009 [Parcubacteria group bacterium GW2011_GWA2_43_13]|nr:MAG: hypothetical protein UV70_C0002G0009 [Parcubacteria group bacterium GW2011_GWA2_43_13]OGY70482.1 MAG: hypothetical protein A2986_02025 [Candidatus Jacksonbacteria bacterium RIFCSPLOWO2_01_FULL_44_13]HAZ16408.1 hypothetical protein [Candidatus Jacksonbacteria bacterium]
MQLSKSLIITIILTIIALIVIALIVIVPKRTVEFDKNTDVLRQVTPDIDVPDISKTQARVYIGGDIVVVDVARTDDDRQKGLLGRDSLSSENGMLFEFDSKQEYTFHMQGMSIPLDIIFIDDNTILDMVSRAQPQQESEERKLYSPVGPVNRVLEVPAGFIEEHQLNLGDSVAIEFE